MAMRHTGTVVLETPRLRLRRFEPGDARRVFETWAGDERVARFLTWQPHKSEAETQALLSQWARDYEQPTNYNWALELKQERALVGGIDISSFDEPIDSATVDCCVGFAYWGRGLAAEALAAVCDHLFDAVGAHRVEAVHHLDNLGSGRALQKAGMRFEGIVRGGGYSNAGALHDVALYSILRSDRT